jgi:uncharacterized protein YndB with AHSA1/START domain
MKHLRVLEEAGLVTSRRSGRERLHYLNPVPIRLIHDRWIDKYSEPRVEALADLKHQLEEDVMATTEPARIEVSADRYASHGPDGSVWGEAAVAEFDPPRRLVHGWRSMYNPELAGESESRVTWEIDPQEGGFCRLTVIHDQLEGAPKTAASVSGERWMFVLSGLKTLLETGAPLAA